MSGLEWLRPSLLVALALVPVAIGGIAWSVRRRRRALDRFSEQDVRHRTQVLPAGRPRTRGLLLVTGLGGLVLAAAGPQWGTAPAESVPVPAVGSVSVAVAVALVELVELVLVVLVPDVPDVPASGTTVNVWYEIGAPVGSVAVLALGDPSTART